MVKKSKSGPSWAEEGRAGHFGVPRYSKQQTHGGRVRPKFAKRKLRHVSTVIRKPQAQKGKSKW